MKSSDNRGELEADRLDDGHSVASSASQVTFDMTTLPHKSRSRRILDRIDLPVQAGRIAVIAFVFWFWQSGRLWGGINVWGIQIFPEINPIFTAQPGEVWDFFTGTFRERLFWTDVGVTLQEAAMGFAFGSSAGFLVGVLFGRFRRLARVYEPFLVFANAVPKVALAPILILWYGVDIGSKVALATIIVFFIVQIPVQAATAGVDSDLDVVATTMGASQLQRFSMVVVPGILGPLFGALRLAAVYSILAVVFGEFIASKRGLGQRLVAASNQFNMGDAFALMIVLSVLALLFNTVIGLLERRLLRWQSDAQTFANVIAV